VIQRYLVALGSNVRHHRHGPPPKVLRAALAELAQDGLTVERASKIISTAPLGPSLRRYANAAAIVNADMTPATLLRRLKSIERKFGRRNGRRWAARVLDLDIVLWEGGVWTSRELTVPHVAFRERRFVLEPAAAIAPRWRDPVTGRTLRQLAGLVAKPRKS
jgi:2-amino-4-hydroxy-6-hydroxymethyldihydropteridine diphosphokinase